MNGDDPARPAPIPVTRLLENAALSTDMDCRNFEILNIGHFVPNPPPPLVAIDDPALSDQRPVPAGSVTDTSVSVTAGISQSKLALNGVIPTPWLGNSPIQAAQGNLVQFVSPKGATSGYTPLDSTGRIPSTYIPASLSSGTGSVTSVAFAPPINTALSGSPITGAGTFAVTWTGQPSPSWLGGNAGFKPTFLSGPVPTAFIPSLAASAFTTGVFNAALLPAAVGVGSSNAQGAVPTPGELDATAHPQDYLARDLTWKSITATVAYQPQVPAVQITLVNYYLSQAYVTLSNTLGGASIFYELTPDGGTTGAVIEVDKTPLTILVDQGTRIDAYAAKAGYNLSPISTYIVPYSSF